jgi:hypothetical protein
MYINRRKSPGITVVRREKGAEKITGEQSFLKLDSRLWEKENSYQPW